MNVTIYCIQSPVALHFCCHTLQYIVRSKVIVAIKNSHYVARAMANTLVHGIVYATVGLRNPMQPTAEQRFILTHNIHCIVLRPTVNDPIIYLLICLRKNRPQSILHGLPTVVCSCYE